MLNHQGLLFYCHKSYCGHNRAKVNTGEIQKADKSERLFVPKGTVPLKVPLYKQPDRENLLCISYQDTSTQQLLSFEHMGTFHCYTALRRARTETWADWLYNQMLHARNYK